MVLRLLVSHRRGKPASSRPSRATLTLPPGKFAEVPGQVALDCAADDHLTCGGCGCACHPEPDR